MTKIESGKGAYWQAETRRDNKAFHQNFPDPTAFLADQLPFYRQAHLFSPEKTYDFRLSKKGKILSNTHAGGSAVPARHDRQKEYLINEGDPVPFLVDLGVFTREYKIVRSKYDKFRQINRFLEILDDEMKSFPKEEVSVLDFGCGKSYLTFFIYYYFAVIQKKKVRILGYDLKKDVVDACNALAKKYGCNGLSFVVADVKKDALADEKIDLIVSLHACDTATDYALSYAIDKDVPFIFSVPCCQHEIGARIQKSGGDFDLLLEHGLFKERFSALLTDAIRAKVLKECGYRVEVIEFVDFAHSPKNVMLRAKKCGAGERRFEDLFDLEKRWGFQQTLLHLQGKDGDNGRT